MFQSSLSIKDRNPPMENRKGHRAQEEMKKNLKANIKHHHIDLST